MRTLKGSGVSPGIAIGAAFVQESEGTRIPRKFCMPEEVPGEIERFNEAIVVAAGEVKRLHRNVTSKLDETAELADIFHVHLSLLEDRKLHDSIVTLIKNKNFTAEYAVSQRLSRLVKQLETSGDPYLADRTKDIYDLEHWVLNALVGEERESLQHLTEPVIVVAHDLTPSQTVRLDRERVLAFVTDAGGRTSHTAILARTLAIPAVVGLRNVSRQVSGGDTLIVDGASGEVILSPDETTLNEYRRLSREQADYGAQVNRQYCVLPGVTRDGDSIDIQANIEFPGEAMNVLDYGASGVGLYRTEFLYHAAGTVPDEKAHFDAYMEVVQHLGDAPVTIRTLDLGADKFPVDTDEHNPFLGCRSIRLMLRDKPAFRKQLRAILRASEFGNVRVMLPLVTTLSELRETKELIEDVKRQLRSEGVGFDEQIKIGIMIEVPSAAILADKFAKEADFFSIGTNDLVQYTLAVDRDNESVAHLYTATDPAVLRLIRMTLEAARANGVPCGMCGEMAGDTNCVALLVGMGLREFSMAPKSIAAVKRIVRAISTEGARRIADEACEMATADEVAAFLAEKTREILPQA